MKMKRFFAVIMCALSFTACAQIPPLAETVPEDRQTVIAPPEDGWTAEELMNVSYLDGIQLSYPITLRNLGSAYGIAFDFEDDNGNTVYCIGSGFMAMRSYSQIKFSPDVSEPSPDARIAELQTMPENISVNGITEDSDKDAVIQALGEPDSIEEYTQSSSIYSYLDRNSEKTILKISISNESEKVLAAVFMDQ